MEDKKRNILNKVLSKNYYLNEEDIYYLTKDNDLFNQVFQMIPYNDDNFYYVMDILYNKYSCDAASLKDYISKDDYLKCLLYLIKNERFISLDLIESLIDLSIYTEEEKNLLKDACLYNKLHEDNILVTHQELIELLDNHEYEVISRVEDLFNYYGNNLSNDIIIERLIKEFPFDKYNVKFIFDNIVNFKPIIDKMNIFYSIKDVSLLSEFEVNNLIERLNKGDEILLDSKLIPYIDFDKILELDNNKGDEIIKLLFKNSPLLYFYISYSQNNCLEVEGYSEYLENNLVDYITKDTVLPEKIDNYLLFWNKKIIKKLYETKHFDLLANNFVCLEYFDDVANYIKKLEITIEINQFISIYKNINNKELLKKLISDGSLIIKFGFISSKDIEFLIQENLTSLIFYIINSNKYDLEELSIDFPDYFEQNILNNEFYVFNLINTNFYNMVSLPDNLLFSLFDKVICNNDNVFNKFLLQMNNPDNQNLSIDYSHLFDIIAPSIAKYKNISLDNLLLIKKQYGPKIMNYLDNDAIIKLLRMNNAQFQKFINLFSNKKYEMSDLEKAFDSIIQSQFINNNYEDVEIFHILINYYINDDLKYIELINKIINEVDAQSIKYLENLLNVKLNDFKSYILYLLNNIKNKVDLENSENKLHDICIYYLDKRRGKYKNNIDMVETLNLPFDYETTSLNKYLVKCFLGNKIFFNNIVSNIIDNNKQISRSILREAIEFYIGVKKVTDLKFDFNDIKKLFPIIIKTTNQEIKKAYKVVIEQYIGDIEKNGDVKKIYKLDHSIDFYQILSCLDMDLVEKNILNNSSNYEKLKVIIDKYKLNQIPESLANYLTNNGIYDFSLSTIASFINYFPSIMHDIEANSVNRLNLATFLKYSCVYDSMSSIYRIILGDTDYKLIKSNPKPHEAPSEQDGDKDYRIKIATDAMIESFKRLNITIPAFNNVFETHDGKKIRVVVGNLTNPCNMTHGERTGACMRIGGFANKLFNFCYQNVNGFHIRMEDPETGKYISRVSGFRNGNTVVLNQLRYSLNENYKDDDLIETIKMVGAKLIEDSKDSRYPIQNVILDKSYAAENMDVVDLGVDSVINGLNTYSDISRYAVIVASTKENGFVPLDFDKSHMPLYKVSRDIPKKIDNSDLFLKMSSRIDAIKMSIELNDYQYIPNFSLENGFIMGIIGDDFYCYIDKDYNIVEDYIGIDERGKEELENSKEELRKYIETLKK